ncbi:MAG: 5'/3'-nucleotidase SurE, partial [Oscillospiraceae bacterium]|nr:5'/3'-nucleotidase SurE [Oscillospiraceae bacterium]
QYSATAGAAFEAAFQGFPAIALSEDATGCHEVSDAFLKEILAELLEQEIPAGQILNVNFPGCPIAECRGILRDRTVSRGLIFRDRYAEIAQLPGGGVRLMVDGEFAPYYEPGTDLEAVTQNYISVGTVRNIG